jgi:tellurite resistance protein TerC
VLAVLASDPTAWLALLGAVAVLVAVDLVAVRGEMSVRGASVASVAWLLVAFAFAGVLVLVGEQAAAADYVAGYLVEKSLSLDNVFVFLLVFGAFGIPAARRHRLLTYGILGALVMRAAFILVGSAALHAASWLAYGFAAVLVFTGVKMLRHRHERGGEAALVERLKGRFELADAGEDDHRLLVRRRLTAAGAALVTIAVVDVIFAVDSVPAILAITADAFVVFAANAFAVLGLRPLFFLVAELVERLYHLKTALAVLLVFIGGKMAAGELVGKLGPAYSLGAIALILGTGVAASLLRERRRGAAPAPA